MVVDEFGADSNFQEGLMQFFLALAEVTLPILSQPGGFVNNPDTVDDLFRLSSRSVDGSRKYCNYMFVTNIPLIRPEIEIVADCFGHF